MITIKQIKQMASEIGKAKGYKYIGIRTQEGTHGAEVGQVITHCSNVWDDGEMTSKKLAGVCAVKAGKKYQINQIDSFSGYEGDTVLILGSNEAKKGYDEGEIIMSAPVVLEVRKF